VFIYQIRDIIANYEKHRKDYQEVRYFEQIFEEYLTNNLTKPVIQSKSSKIIK
jgi:hypothetical protein